MTQPHDAFFKATFEEPSRAAELLRTVLPASLCATIDWTALSLEPSAFVDERLGKSHGDLLFSAPLGTGLVMIYVVLEHQSTNEPVMSFRVLKYMVRVWDRYAAEHGGSSLPLLVVFPPR